MLPAHMTLPPRRRLAVLLGASVLLAGAAPALANDAGAHVDPTAAVALALAVVLLCAKLFGDLAVRVGQPAVLGELVAGVVLGNAVILGVPWFEPLKADPALDLLARLSRSLLREPLHSRVLQGAKDEEIIQAVDAVDAALAGAAKPEVRP